MEINFLKNAIEKQGFPWLNKGEQMDNKSEEF